MPERWERELQTLRRAEPRADLWARVEEGPHGSPTAPPSGRKRLVSGGVAFAVFIAAGLFAWNAFQPTVQEGLPPAGAPQAIMAFNEADPRLPELSLTVGGATHPATLGTHSYPFAGGNGYFDAVTPTFVDADAIPVVRGTPLLIANAPPTLAMSAYEGLTGPPVGTPPTLDLTEPGWNFDLRPGRYLMVVDAQWDDASAQFWLPIEVVTTDAASPTPPGTSVLDRYGVLVTYPPGWTLAPETLTPTLTDPSEVFALGTYPLRPGGSGCVQFPTDAIEDLGPTDALVWLADRPLVHPDTVQRPEPMDAWLRAQPSDVSGECLSAPKDFVHHHGVFTDAGREFEIYVAYGAEASPDTIAELWNIVNSVRVRSMPSG